MPGRHTWSCRGHLLGQFHLLSSYSKTRCTLLWDYETLQQYLLVRGRENTHPLPSPTVSLENQSYNPLVTGHYWREIGSRYEIQSTPKKSQEGSTTENQTVVMSLLHNANNLSQHLWGSTLTLQSPRQESAVVFYLFVKSLHVTSPYVVVMWCWLNTPFQKKALSETFCKLHNVNIKEYSSYKEQNNCGLGWLSGLILCIFFFFFFLSVSWFFCEIADKLYRCKSLLFWLWYNILSHNVPPTTVSDW